jgi:putative ABC transport system ATP-binding protein
MRMDTAMRDGERRPSVLVASGLTKVYRTGEVAVHALRGVDLELYEGELIVLLGASGSGKSTLLNIVGGLDVPTDGTVSFDGVPLKATSDRALIRFRRDNVGFVFQFYNLIASLTAEENVALVTEIAPDPMTPADAPRLVGLGDRLQHFPAQLSGGEQQRVAIARAIVNNPAILLADEPTGNLDTENSLAVLETLKHLNQETGQTILMITHNPEAASYCAHRIVKMRDGRIVEG